MFKYEPGFTRVATLDEIRQHDCNLSIPLYVAPAKSEVREDTAKYGEPELEQVLATWLESSHEVRRALDAILRMTPSRTGASR
jgi:type I restriction-modification system DNA methylase subunit